MAWHGYMALMGGGCEKKSPVGEDTFFYFSSLPPLPPLLLSLRRLFLLRWWNEGRLGGNGLVGNGLQWFSFLGVFSNTFLGSREMFIVWGFCGDGVSVFLGGFCFLGCLCSRVVLFYYFIPSSFWWFVWFWGCFAGEGEGGRNGRRRGGEKKCVYPVACSISWYIYPSFLQTCSGSRDHAGRFGVSGFGGEGM